MGILRTDKISGLETPTAVTGSVLFDGTNDDLQIADSNDFTFEKNDFTIEFWRYKQVTAVDTYVAKYGSGSSTRTFWFGQGSGGEEQFYWYSGSNAYSIDGGAFPINTWAHLAAVRYNGTMTLYVDGVEVASTTSNVDVSLNDTTESLRVGGEDTGTYDYQGYISNLRILNGTALYTSEFTPPVHELEVIGDTVLLCCNNSDSAGAEGTGKSITVNNNAAASTFSPGLTRDFTSGTEFRGVTTFDTQGYFVPPSGTTTDRNRTGGRAVFGGGTKSPGSSNLSSIEFISITTQGNAQDFGDLLVATRTKSGGGVSSPTRGVTAGGYDTGNVSRIEFITISSTGNSVNFGATLATAGRNLASASNSTRGLFFGGDNRATEIDFITIASLGTRTAFGTIPSPGNANVAGLASPTRAVFGGGYRSGVINKIEYVTISTTGNAVDFGDVTVARSDPGACSSSTRGIFAAGGVSPSVNNTIDYITIATLGNAQDFGDLIETKSNPGGTSNSIRGVFAGNQPTFNNIIEFITIASTGNANDFGDLIQGRSQAWSCSDSHGGIS